MCDEGVRYLRLVLRLQFISSYSELLLLLQISPYTSLISDLYSLPLSSVEDPHDVTFPGFLWPSPLQTNITLKTQVGFPVIDREAWPVFAVGRSEETFV